MKYLKLFENFNEEPNIEDAKWIVISHLGEVEEVEIEPKWNAKGLIKFELQEKPSEEQIKKCTEHLKTEDFFFIINDIDNLSWFESIEAQLNLKDRQCIVGIGKIEEYAFNWLNNNFSDLKRVEKYNRFYYTDQEGKPVFCYYPNDERCEIDFRRIWIFIKYYLLIDSKQTKEIISEWLEKIYKLKGKKPQSLDFHNTTITASI